MTSNIKYFKEKLEGEKALVENGLRDLGTAPSRNPSDFQTTLEPDTETADKNISADRKEDYEQRHAVTDALEIRLANISAALRKIEEGKYGICEIGGKEIERDRLEANPSAKTCKKHLNDQARRH